MAAGDDGTALRSIPENQVQNTGMTPRVKSCKIKEIQKTRNSQNFQKTAVPRCTKFTSTVPGRLYTQLIKK